MSVASYTRRIKCITMEKACNFQELDFPDAFEVIGEPAVVINGVPDVMPGVTTTILDDTSDSDSDDDPFFGDWLEGRKIRKLFGDQYYAGIVEKYDKEANWYRAVYEDGDFEDLEWHELEEVLLPLDISIPLTTLASYKCKSKKSGSKSQIKSSKGRKNHTSTLGSKEKTLELPQISLADELRDEKQMQRQNGSQTEIRETNVQMHKHDESLFGPQEYTIASNICNGQESVSECKSEKSLASHMCDPEKLASHKRRSENSVSKSQINLSKGGKTCTNISESRVKKSEMLHMSQVATSREGMPMQMQNELQFEDKETYFQMYKLNESLSASGHYTVASNICNGPESNAAPVFEVIGEPAIVINGVPDSTLGCISSILDTIDNQDIPCFGQWIEGRKVQKLFGDRYYSGKVEKYDVETKWYRVVYEDGDFEDLEWRELEDLLVPVDVSIPLTTLALNMSKFENSVSKPWIKLAEERKKHTDCLQRMEKIVEPDACKRTPDVTSQVHIGLPIESIEPLQMCKHEDSVSNSEEGTTTSNDKQKGESNVKMLNHTRERADINSDELDLRRKIEVAKSFSETNLEDRA